VIIVVPWHTCILSPKCFSKVDIISFDLLIKLNNIGFMYSLKHTWWSNGMILSLSTLSLVLINLRKGKVRRQHIVRIGQSANIRFLYSFLTDLECWCWTLEDLCIGIHVARTLLYFWSRAHTRHTIFACLLQQNTDKNKRLNRHLEEMVREPLMNLKMEQIYFIGENFATWNNIKE